MRCPSCSHDNSVDASFCDSCGAKLESICATCGTANQPGARFCKKCGTRIAAESAPARPAAASTAPKVRVAPEQTVADAPALEGERKTVTALFADIKGSTEMMEDLDPEQARSVIDPALNLMMDAVQRYDGYIVQSTGDGIFALFGAPVAHEDHPQRALYAALRMQEELKRYSAKLREAGNLPLEARVGVNSGEVVIRSITTGAGHTEYTPIGHTANLASRMQVLAPTGSIAISEQTRALVEGYFALKPLGPTKVKGVSEPVNVYEITGLGPLRTRLQRSAGRGFTKFVGREREMASMEGAAERAKSGHGQIVAAMAEAGTGKSRLFFEFKAKNQSGWMVLEAFSVSHGKASAYLPVIDLLQSYFRISGEDDQRVRREKVAGRLSILDPSLEDARPYLFALLGIVEGEDPLAQTDAQTRKRRTLDAIKRILLRESLNQPLMVIFEDLHWIDEQTQELLNLLADSIGTARILMLVNYRPEYSQQWGSKTYYTQLHLDPLGKENADEMLSSLLGDHAEVRPLKRLIVEKTEGNPFFMEEIVQALFEQGALLRNGAVKLARSLNSIEIPPTVQGVLASRIDRLLAEQKDLLNTLAVIGKEFSLSLVRAVFKKSDDEISRMLNDLQLAEFIYEQPAVGDIDYTFKHALTQEVAYNSVLIERRKALHERAGQALESMYAEQLNDHLAELAHHYSRSSNGPKAVEYLRLAGQQATQRSANAEAINNFASALEILKSLPDTPQRARQELELETLLGPALIATKGNAAPEVGAVYERAVELARQVGEDAQLFPVLFGLRSYHFVRGELRPASELAQQLVSSAESLQDSGLLAEAHLARGNSLFVFGELLPALDHFEQAVTIYDPRKHHSHALLYGLDPGVFCLARIAWGLTLSGYPDRGLQKAGESIALAQQQAHHFSLAVALNCASNVHDGRRDWPAMQREAEAAIALCTEQGFEAILAQSTMHRGIALVAQGRTQEGIALIQHGSAASQATGARLFRSHFLTYLARAFLTAGRFEEGLTAAAKAIAITGETGESLEEAMMLRLKGELLLALDSSNAAAADRSFREAIEVSRRQSTRLFELEATTSLARLLAKQGKRGEARAMLAEIYNWFSEGFDTADLKDAKALLDELSAA
jgi:class 3 adenylate cyclase/predicted ATPase